MANKWSAVWLFVMQLAGLSSAFGQTPVAEGSGSCSLYLTYSTSGCTAALTQTGSRGTTVSDSAAAFTETPGSPANAYGSVSYASRYAYGDIGIRLDSIVRSEGVLGEAAVIADARFVDYVTLTSATLPVGQPIALTVSGSLNWGAAAGITGSLQNDSNYVFEFWNGLTVNSTSIFQGVYGNTYGPFGLDPNNPPPQTTYLTDPHTTFSQTVNARVGDTLMVQGDIHGRFVSHAVGQIAQGAVVSERVDALGSAHTFITASNSNIQLVALSGHNYAAPVPEPESWAMLICGLGLLFRFRRISARADSEE